MAEISEKHLEEQHGSHYGLENVQTKNTVSTGFDPQDDPDFKFGFTRVLVFLVRSS